ncbi:MAG TPA: C40 family peptidase [Nocardioidaceae bacterium]
MTRTVRKLLGVVLASALPLSACGQGSQAPPSESRATHSTPSADTSASQGGSSASPPSTGDPTRARFRVGGSAWVTVSVATVWRSPDSPRDVDAPALTRPVRLEGWLAGMTVDERRGLNGRADTQVLLGDEVRVVGLTRRWAEVVVPTQPTPSDARGYPGWVPLRQLTATRPTAARQVATVVTRTAWLRTDHDEGRRLLRVSYGTRLPVMGLGAGYATVATPSGRRGRVDRTSVVVHRPDEPAVPPEAESLVAGVGSFVGLPYLWAGASGFGVDCSGLTWLVHRVHGVTIPRDAAAQAEQGAPAPRLLPGDLMFYAVSGSVHHVSMYVGEGRMVHAPGTGESVELATTDTRPYADEFLVARRYLP